MKKTIRFSKLFKPAVVFSILLMAAGIAGYFVLNGINLGVDFQAGMIQEVRFAPTAFTMTWSGRGNAIVSFDRNKMDVVNSGIGVEPQTLTFPFSDYGTLGALCEALEAGLEGIHVELLAPENSSSLWMVHRAQGDRHLSDVPYVVHYLNPESEIISIGTVRDALSSLGSSISVQSLGQPSDRHFMIRDSHEEETEVSETGIPAYSDEEEAGVTETGTVVQAGGTILGLLEEYFGEGNVVIMRSDYVGSRFSKNLADQAGILIGLTLLVMLLYVTIRFKAQYGIGLVIGIIHDGLVIVAFIIWSGMEFNITTIAAILTILGYSTNNTIIVFDRVRENRRIYPDEAFVNILDISLTSTLNRTIITTFSTMLAVMSLFIFTTGAMKDFALALMVGMISGVYTTTFIASGFVNFWEKQKVKKEKKKIAALAQARGTAVSKV